MRACVKLKKRKRKQDYHTEIKKNLLNDNDHFGFEEVRFKRNLRKRKQQIPFFSLEPTIYGVS